MKISNESLSSLKNVDVYLKYERQRLDLSFIVFTIMLIFLKEILAASDRLPVVSVFPSKCF